MQALYCHNVGVDHFKKVGDNSLVQVHGMASMNRMVANSIILKSLVAFYLFVVF